MDHRECGTTGLKVCTDVGTGEVRTDHTDGEDNDTVYMGAETGSALSTRRYAVSRPRRRIRSYNPTGIAVRVCRVVVQMVSDWIRSKFESGSEISPFSCYDLLLVLGMELVVKESNDFYSDNTSADNV